jgi:hypothetical protein
MKKLLGIVFLSGAVALTTFSTSDTLAQGKKKAAAGGTIELKESKDGKYRFTVRDADGKYLGGSSTPHATEKEAKEAAEELKAVIATAKYVSVPKK